MDDELNSPRTEASHRRQTAFHEAGHAVVGWALHRPIGWVWLFSAGNGKAQIDRCFELPAVDQIAIAFAGRIAGNMCGEPRMEDDFQTNDWVHAYNVAARECRDEDGEEDEGARDRLMRDGFRRARRLLGQHWPLVEKVSVDLDCYGALGEGVVAALAAAGKEPTMPVTGAP